MNKKNVVKKDLLRRKVHEYFLKNPSAKSVIVKAGLDDSKTLWKVVREGKFFRVTEVNTKKEEFIFESGISVVKESSVEFSKLSTLFTQAMQPPFDHTKLSTALRTANSAVSRIVDPKEKQDVGAMIGVLTNLVDSTTAGGGSKIQTRSSSFSGTQPVTTLKQSFVRIGKIVKEDEEKKDKKKDDNKSDSEPKKTKPKPKQEPKATNKLDPSDEPEDDAGLETSASLDGPQDDLPAKQPSSEEMVVSKSLTGQTIKAANIQLNPQGGEFTLDLVSAAVPAKLQWSKTGKVVFYVNGRPYVLNRE
mgnify:CR=1 FL=1